jgi:glycosyltransferase involved in cell wall biosynthesis
MNIKKIFIGPNEIAGQYRNLAIALRHHGVNCDYYTFYVNRFSYGDDLGSDLIPAVMRKINTFGKAKGFIFRILSVVFFETLRIIFFMKCLFKYDIFLFGYGISLLRYNIDIPLLKFFKKRVIANLSHGSDMTPAYLDGALLNEFGEMPSVASQLKIVRAQKKCISIFEKYADLIIGSPLSSSYLSSKPFIDIITIGRLCQAQYFDFPKIKFEKNNKIRIIHVPSHAPGKGTIIIRNIMEKISHNFDCFEYIELSGLTNNEVLLELASADLLIDQVYSDLPLSGLGMEAFVCGVPVLISGYGLNDLKKRYPENNFPPVFSCMPEDLESSLEYLLLNKSFLVKLGIQSKEFTLSNWSPQLVVDRYIKLIYGDEIPSHWWHKPQDFLYLYGYGLSKASSAINIENIIKKYGQDGLSLSSRYDLQEKFIERASNYQ